jgi:hypothetical protein
MRTVVLFSMLSWLACTTTACTDPAMITEAATSSHADDASTLKAQLAGALLPGYPETILVDRYRAQFFLYEAENGQQVTVGARLPPVRENNQVTLRVYPLWTNPRRPVIPTLWEVSRNLQVYGYDTHGVADPNRPVWFSIQDTATFDGTYLIMVTSTSDKPAPVELTLFGIAPPKGKRYEIEQEIKLTEEEGHAPSKAEPSGPGTSPGFDVGMRLCQEFVSKVSPLKLPVFWRCKQQFNEHSREPRVIAQVAAYRETGLYQVNVVDVRPRASTPRQRLTACMNTIASYRESVVAPNEFLLGSCGDYALDPVRASLGTLL